MKTEMLNENTVLINDTTFSITTPVLDNFGTTGEVAFYSTATNVNENADVTEVRIYWPTQTGVWDDVSIDEFYIRTEDQFKLSVES
jgi:hypothetical protein